MTESGRQQPQLSEQVIENLQGLLFVRRYKNKKGELENEFTYLSRALSFHATGFDLSFVTSLFDPCPWNYENVVYIVSVSGESQGIITPKNINKNVAKDEEASFFLSSAPPQLFKHNPLEEIAFMSPTTAYNQVGVNKPVIETPKLYACLTCSGNNGSEVSCSHTQAYYCLSQLITACKYHSTLYSSTTLSWWKPLFFEGSANYEKSGWEPNRCTECTSPARTWDLEEPDSPCRWSEDDDDYY